MSKEHEDCRERKKYISVSIFAIKALKMLSGWNQQVISTLKRQIFLGRIKE